MAAAPTSLETLLAGAPAARAVPAAEVAEAARASDRVLVVLDDDPTGTQSVADLPVLLTWTAESLEWALGLGAPAVYVMTNSRSLAPADAARRNREVARAAFAAAAKVGVRIDFVSRSDSTLRGHFPLEPDVLAEEVRASAVGAAAAATGARGGAGEATATDGAYAIDGAHGGDAIDGVVIVPAFGDAGRVTVGAVHYAGSASEGFVPVGETEFARDATFGYESSDLRDWVAEKTGGRVAAAAVAWIPLATLRTDPDATAAVLATATGARPIVCDIVDENDLRLLALALHAAERAGKRFLYRVGPPFVRAVIGQDVPEPLTAADVDRLRGCAAAPADGRGGLIVVGSHVSLTTRQLDHLVETDDLAVFEIDVPTVLSPGAASHLDEVAERAAAALAEGDVLVRTSRSLVRDGDRDESLAIARQVSTAVVTIVRHILDRRRPAFVVAKGGITSSDVAARGLSIERAMVRGPMLPGIVSLWEPVAGPARGIPYVVFPGNVGGPDSLADVVAKLGRRGDVGGRDATEKH